MPTIKLRDENFTRKGGGDTESLFMATRGARMTLERKNLEIAD